ncbi:MAG: phosphate acyltransferase PlsX [Elusimicrobia bacterium GWC2_65_9]|nr:MAG: phosphate acyltransferase PlsX [Elusimicrobia bacterium GWA2_66_18]OGR70941.1 MAG: phosphate acyltransferase PlsX [Elusimicrobia bacterium GWC2_65_9]
MKIALDTAGGDDEFTSNIDGAVQAANAWGMKVVLVGPAERVRSELTARGVAPDDTRFEVVDAPELIGMDEDPAVACRAKPRASILVAAELVAQGHADGLVSAGHPGATMVAALWHLKRIPGVLRPAIAVPVPTARGVTLVLDGGANMDCKPWHLVQFALMGTIIFRHLHGRQNATVGLLTIDKEEGKGNDLVRETFPRLKSAGLEFCGAVEGRDVPAGKTDVVVCDGFVGSVVVKTMEGAALAVMGMLKSEILATWRRRLAGILLKGPFTRLKRKMSCEEYGGALLVGVNGIVVSCHGSSNARAIAHAVRAAARTAESGLVAAMKEAVARADACDETVPA